MSKQMRIAASITFSSLVIVAAPNILAAQLDLVPAAHVTILSGGERRAPATFDKSEAISAVELEWDEERDISELELTFDGTATHAKSIEYWFKNWPYEQPKMPSMEDPLDDPWQGEWLKAEVREECSGGECRYSFQPLTARENSRHDFFRAHVIEEH
jgi:hypothetical protein